jgi:hypothetical protein
VCQNGTLKAPLKDTGAPPFPLQTPSTPPSLRSVGIRWGDGGAAAALSVPSWHSSHRPRQPKAGGDGTLLEEAISLDARQSGSACRGGVAVPVQTWLPGRWKKRPDCGQSGASHPRAAVMAAHTSVLAIHTTATPPESGQSRHGENTGFGNRSSLAGPEAQSVSAESFLRTRRTWL